MVPEKRMFRPDEVASIIAMSSRTVYRMMQDGSLPYITKNGHRFVLREDVEGAIECQQNFQKS